MKTPITQFTHRARRAVGALALTLTAAALVPAAAGAHISPAQAQRAADRGAAWFEATQEETGQLTSDWGMTALAAAGVNAADVQFGLADPSAQDYYLDEWRASGPGGVATDAERGILAGESGGIQTSRLSTASETERSNLVARVAELYDGTQVGDPGLVNDDIFAVLALDQVSAPQPLLDRLLDYVRSHQLPDGGWSYSASPTASSDTDMTGSAIAAFCAAGVPTSDPQVQHALSLLHSMQDPASGGFIAPPPFGVGVNTDTTGWVTSGLIECGIDPQGPEWTTAQGKTPFDYLVSLQRPDGHFEFTAEYSGGPFETYDSVRPLAGAAFSAPAPARLDATSPAMRPAPTVEAGTTVPVTLVINHGPAADDVRMCRVDVPQGTSLPTLLAAAQASSAPAGCVSESSTTEGADGTRIASLDGVSAGNGYEWQIRIDGDPASATSAAPIGLGDLVYLRFAAIDADAPPIEHVAVPQVRSPAPTAIAGLFPRVKFVGRARLDDDGLGVVLECPRGLGAGGCRGLLSARVHTRAGKASALGGSAVFAIGSGDRASVDLAPTKVLRRRLRAGRKVALRLVAVTRGELGEAQTTLARRVVTG